MPGYFQMAENINRPDMVDAKHEENFAGNSGVFCCFKIVLGAIEPIAIRGVIIPNHKPLTGLLLFPPRRALDNLIAFKPREGRFEIEAKPIFRHITDKHPPRDVMQLHSIGKQLVKEDFPHTDATCQSVCRVDDDCLDFPCSHQAPELGKVRAVNDASSEILAKDEF